MNAAKAKENKVDWWVVAKTGDVVLWKSDPKAGIAWVDEHGNVLPEGTQVKRVRDMDRDYLRDAVLSVHDAELDVPEDTLFDDVLAWVMDMAREDFDGEIPDVVYLLTDPDPQGRSVTYLGSEQEAVDLGYLKPGEQLEDTPSQSEPSDAPVEKVPLYQVGMKRHEMISVIGQECDVDKSLLPYFLTAHAEAALRDWDAGDMDSYNAVIEAVKQRKAEKEQKKADQRKAKKEEEESVQPPAPEKSDAPEAPVMEEASEEVTPIQESSQEGTDGATLHGLLVWAKGREWDWKDTLPRCLEHVSPQDVPVLKWVYGCVTREGVLDALMSNGLDEEVAQRMVDGGEMRGVPYPGIVDILKAYGLIEVY